MKKQLCSERRSFLAKVNAGAASIAAVALGQRASAQVRSAASGRWEPARHGQDNWMDEIPGKHRLIFDTTYPNGLADALVFANNFLVVNRDDYGLQNNDLAVILVARHFSTPFAYNDAMWAKYGAHLAKLAQVEDPRTKAAPAVNLYNAAGDIAQLGNRGVTFDALAKQGVQFAVCSMATQALADIIATAVGGKAGDIRAELVAHLVASARMVPAGIVAVSRAQERGYTLVSSDRLS